MGTCLARSVDWREGCSCFKGPLRLYVDSQDSPWHFFSTPDLNSPGETNSPMKRARTWSSSQQKERYRKFQHLLSSPKRLKADELDFGELSLHERASSIMHHWKFRGAYRPITAFYEFERKLGEGAFGSVSKWRLHASTQAVAVKQIKWRKIWHGFFRNRAAEQAIRKELKLLLVLDNPFIIKFREWFEDLCKGIFFVMELCSGPSLQSILEDVCKQSDELRREKLPKFRRHFREISYAISYLYGMEPPVVHRDLKPENILLADCTEHGTVRLIDFGLASWKTDEDAPLAVGTMVFMAPETFTNVNVELDQQTDVWALGVILMWMMTALQSGSLQHPCLDQDEGREFDVKWIALYNAFRDQVPWNRSLIPDYLAVAPILDKVLVYQPEERCHAYSILEDPWLCVSDPAISASAELLERGSLLYNLRTFGDLTDLEKKIVSLVADHAPDSKLALLRRTFRAFDTSRQGVLNVSELIEGFRRHDVQISEELIRDLFNAVDIDHNKVISYQEWLAATIGPGILDSEAALEACFRRLDPEANGCITREDLIRAVGEEGADEVFAIDEDSFFAIDEITFEEFKDMARKIGEKRAGTSQSSRRAISVIGTAESLAASVRPKRNTVTLTTTGAVA